MQHDIIYCHTCNEEITQHQAAFKVFSMGDDDDGWYQCAHCKHRELMQEDDEDAA